MRWKTSLVLAGLTLAGAVSLPAATLAAVSADDFIARTTGQLVSLCESSASDPSHVAAVHFCEGFMVGAYRYHESENAGPRGTKLFCLPTSGMTRDHAVNMFVQWAHEHPQYMNEGPIDSLTRFAISTWPCGK